MRSSAFILIVCAFAFSCDFKDAQGLDQTKSVPSLFHRINRARKANIQNQIITAREAEPLTKCEKLRDEALRMKNQGRIGGYVPQCREDGSFEPKQCWASTGYCWCVDKSGNEIPGTQTRSGNQELQCNETAEPLTKCEKLRDEALGKENQGRIGGYVPQCTEDGSFEPKQCWGSIGYCWCVDENGKEINGTRTKFGHLPPLECQQTSEEKKRAEAKYEKLRGEAHKNPEKRHRLAGHRKTKLV